MSEKNAKLNKSTQPRNLSVVKAFRLDKETADGLDDICTRAGYTASEWLRDAVLGNRTQVIARRSPSPDYKRLLFLANKASNNLNELAHRANTDHLAGRLGEASYQAILTELHGLSRFFKGMLDVDAD